MSRPVVHFEVIAKDPARLRKYFGELFGWQFDTPSPVAQEVSDPDSYGFTTGRASGVVSEADRITRATLSSTWACRMSRSRCDAPKNSEAPA